MKLLSQDIKREMEECKKRARAVGLEFQDNTLEYIVTNRDMLELSPKIMIPSLYDYWVHDVKAISNKRVYEAFPHNPYETVINTYPPRSFYNQDNADWFNVMIFYHVLGHIDYFQNNVFFRKTWDDDFYGQALADKRLLNRIRDERGAERRWVDYVVEFSRAIDNLVGYYPELTRYDKRKMPSVFGASSERIDFYFGRFLRKLRDERRLEIKVYYDELDRYNKCLAEHGEAEGEKAFFADPAFRGRFPEFQSMFKKWKEKEGSRSPTDIFEYLWEHSEVLNKEENLWMKEAMQVVRRTSLYFQPQMRTKMSNEGWASLWHQRLYIPDERISGHEVDWAKVDAGVTAMPRIGFNPYGGFMRLYEFIEDMARKGKLSPEYHLLKGIDERKKFDQARGEAYGRQVLFEAREHFNDELLLNFLSDEDFQDFVDRYRFYIVGIRPHPEKWDKAEVYIKSKSGTDFRELMKQYIYHPPHIIINEDKAVDGELYLDHVYEGMSLNAKHIPNVLIGLEYLWGKRVALETTEYEEVWPSNIDEWYEWNFQPRHMKTRVVYLCEDGLVEKDIIWEEEN